MKILYIAWWVLALVFAILVLGSNIEGLINFDETDTGWFAPTRGSLTRGVMHSITFAILSGSSLFLIFKKRILPRSKNERLAS